MVQNLSMFAAAAAAIAAHCNVSAGVVIIARKELKTYSS